MEKNKHAQQPATTIGMPHALSDINLHCLEKEWSTHSRRVLIWNEKLAKAQRDLLDAKDRMDVIEADLKLKITAKPEEFGLTKGTIPLVDAAIVLQPEYQMAVKRISSLRYKVDMLEAATRALEHRKKALSDEVTLWLAGYFATPKPPTDEEAREKLTEERFKRLSQKTGKPTGSKK